MYSLNQFKEVLSIAYRIYPCDELYYLNSVLDSIILKNIDMNDDVIVGVYNSIEGIDSEISFEFCGISLQKYWNDVINEYGVLNQ